jgi:hypothetical protein
LRLDGSPAVQNRALFFLSALLTSDDSDKERTSRFSNVISLVVAEYLTNFVSLETRETSLSLMQQLIERGLIHVDSPRRNVLAALGVNRIQMLRDKGTNDHAMELELWERLLTTLASL